MMVGVIGIELGKAAERKRAGPFTVICSGINLSFLSGAGYLIRGGQALCI